MYIYIYIFKYTDVYFLVGCHSKQICLAYSRHSYGGVSTQVHTSPPHGFFVFVRLWVSVDFKGAGLCTSMHTRK